jgi:hypothetical protein
VGIEIHPEVRISGMLLHSTVMIAITYYTFQKSRRKDFESIHHKEMINV